MERARSADRPPTYRRQPAGSSFDAFALDYQVTGRFGECLDRLKDRLADPVGDRVVEGLRVADASVMPAMVCANTALTVVLIGERIAALLRES